jgi:hypothetical protein
MRPSSKNPAAMLACGRINADYHVVIYDLNSSLKVAIYGLIITNLNSLFTYSKGQPRFFKSRFFSDKVFW